MKAEKRLALRRKRRAWRVRRGVRGNAGRPRLTVFRSNRHIYAQLVDDLEGRSLAQASTLETELRVEVKKPWSRDAAGRVGEILATRAKAAGISKAAFDRGSYRFHGRVRALAEGARKGGLQF